MPNKDGQKYAEPRVNPLTCHKPSRFGIWLNLTFLARTDFGSEARVGESHKIGEKFAEKMGAEKMKLAATEKMD